MKQLLWVIIGSFTYLISITAGKTIATPTFASATSTLESVTLDAGRTEESWAHYCEYEDKLTSEQIQVIFANYDRIEKITEASSMSDEQDPIISLTEEQKEFVLNKYGVIFSPNPPVDEIFEAAPPSGRSAGAGNPGGSTTRIRVCPPDVSSYKVITLGVNATGSPVQVVQLPDVMQWFIEEKCKFSTSPVAHAIDCREAHHLTFAVVVNLADTDSGIHMEEIRVQSCAAFLPAGHI